MGMAIVRLPYLKLFKRWLIKMINIKINLEKYYGV